MIYCSQNGQEEIISNRKGTERSRSITKEKCQVFFHKFQFNSNTYSHLQWCRKILVFEPKIMIENLAKKVGRKGLFYLTFGFLSIGKIRLVNKRMLTLRENLRNELQRKKKEQLRNLLKPMKIGSFILSIIQSLAFQKNLKNKNPDLPTKGSDSKI